MNTKITFVLCLTVFMTKAWPISNSLENSLEKLGLGFKDIYDYNTYILGIETVLENAQKAAIDAIEEVVYLAEEFARVVKSLGTQQNVKEINAIQIVYFQRIEDMRHTAFNQKIDISSCAFDAVHRLNTESTKSVLNVTNILTNISNTFTNYSQSTYAEPASQNLEKTYTVRERIYKCPFSFTDFKPFFTCLTANAVLQDIIILNDFTTSLNSTLQDIYNLIIDYTSAASLFRTENVEAYNVTAERVYNELLVPCVREQGVIGFDN